MSLKHRVGQLERASIGFATSLQGTVDAIAERDMRAIKKRCEMILEFSEDDPARAEQMRLTIARIDSGDYPALDPVPTNMDERAKRMTKLLREQYLAEYGSE